MPNGKLRRVLDDEEAEQLLSTFNTRYRSPHRDWLACRLMYEAGLRVSEVVSLRTDQLEATPAGGEIVVRDGKGGVDRRLGIGRELRSDLEEWMERLEEEYPESPWLFPTRNGKHVRRNHLFRTVKRAAERAELPEAGLISPHTLRHSFATRWLRRGGNLEALRRALGHADLRTTQEYLNLLDDEHVEAMQDLANASG